MHLQPLELSSSTAADISGAQDGGAKEELLTGSESELRNRVKIWHGRKERRAISRKSSNN